MEISRGTRVLDWTVYWCGTRIGVYDGVGMPILSHRLWVGRLDGEMKDGEWEDTRMRESLNCSIPTADKFSSGTQ